MITGKSDPSPCTECTALQFQDDDSRDTTALAALFKCLEVKSDHINAGLCAWGHEPVNRMIGRRLGNKKGFAVVYAGLYSRLFLVSRGLGKTNNAGKYYRLASEYLRRDAAEEGRALPSSEDIDHMIKDVDGLVGAPMWRRDIASVTNR